MSGRAAARGKMRVEAAVRRQTASGWSSRGRGKQKRKK